MDCLESWHGFVKNRDVKELGKLLAEDVIFHSPVVWSPQHGKTLTIMYLTGAMHVLGNENFRYVKEIIGANQACLEFETKIGDIVINGVDILTWNRDGKITEFKVMIRPIKALNLVWKEMAAMLEKVGQ